MKFLNITDRILRKLIPLGINLFENSLWNIDLGLEVSAEIAECIYSSMTNMTNVTIKSYIYFCLPFFRLPSECFCDVMLQFC